MTKLHSFRCCRVFRRDQSGFTLIEVVISLFLLYLISGVLLNVVTVGTVGLGASQRQTVAWAYGASLLEEMKACPERFIISGDACTVSSEEAAFVTAPPEGMTAQLEVEPVGNVPGVCRVTVRIFGVEGERQWEEYLLGFVRLDPQLL
mgnify:CR=1 FL=1